MNFKFQQKIQLTSVEMTDTAIWLNSMSYLLNTISFNKIGKRISASKMKLIEKRIQTQIDTDSIQKQNQMSRPKK